MGLELCDVCMTLSQIWMKNLYMFVYTLSKMNMKDKHLLKVQSIKIFH
jgi:hypothetical protein